MYLVVIINRMLCFPGKVGFEKERLWSGRKLYSGQGLFQTEDLHNGHGMWLGTIVPFSYLLGGCFALSFHYV